MTLKHNVVKDILCVVAYGTSVSRSSAAKLLFYYWPAFDPNLFDRRVLLTKLTSIKRDPIYCRSILNPFAFQMIWCHLFANANNVPMPVTPRQPKFVMIIALVLHTPQTVHPRFTSASSVLMKYIVSTPILNLVISFTRCSRSQWCAKTRIAAPQRNQLSPFVSPPNAPVTMAIIRSATVHSATVIDTIHDVAAIMWCIVVCHLPGKWTRRCK